MKIIKSRHLFANTTAPSKELNVVLEEKLHGLDILSPDKLSPYNSKLFPPECWWLQRRGIFLASLQNIGNCGLLGLHLPSSRAGYILYLQANNYKLQILSFSIINLLSSASSSSSSSRISSDSSKSSSLLLGLKGRCCAANWLRFFVITQVLFFTAERVPISDLPNNWRLSTTNYYPSEITAQFVTSLRSAACCSCYSARRSCGICLRRSGWN